MKRSQPLAENLIIMRLAELSGRFTRQENYEGDDTKKRLMRLANTITGKTSLHSFCHHNQSLLITLTPDRSMQAKLISRDYVGYVADKVLFASLPRRRRNLSTKNILLADGAGLLLKLIITHNSVCNLLGS